MENINKPEISGEELYSRFLTGDSDSFEKLVSLYENELYLFINGIINDRHEAKHLMIESFARLAIGGKKFAGKSSIKTYLFTIAKNIAVRYAKKRGRERYVTLEDADIILNGKNNDLDSFMEREDNKQWVQDAMGNLKEEYRSVLICIYYKDLSYKETGKAMGKSEAQVRLLAQRARAALKRELSNNSME